MAELKLYDYSEIVDDGWWGSYEQYFVIGQGKLSAGVVVPLIEAVPEGEEIKVMINSCGGYVFDGWAIYNALKKHKGNIVVSIDGLAASIASVIAMAGDEVIACQASLLMIHKPTGDYWWAGSMDAEDLKREARALDQIQAVLNSIYQTKTGLDAATIDSMINSETWITPQEAVTLGFANRIENTITETTMAENAFNQIFKNAQPSIRAYANKTIKINKAQTQGNMSNVKETLDAVKENTKETTNLLDWFKNDFPKLFKKNEVENPVVEAVDVETELENGTKLYSAEAIAVDVMVYTDAEMTVFPENGDHTLMDGRTITVEEGKVTAIAEVEAVAEEVTNESLQEQINLLTAENQSLQDALNTSNANLTAVNKVIKDLKDTKSNFTPPAKPQNFSKPKNTTEDGKPDLSNEAREARRIEREEIRNKKNNKK